MAMMAKYVHLSFFILKKKHKELSKAIQFSSFYERQVNCYLFLTSVANYNVYRIPLLHNN